MSNPALIQTEALTTKATLTSPQFGLRIHTRESPHGRRRHPRFSQAADVIGTSAPKADQLTIKWNAHG